eukprot:SAG31_NODE_12331_length_949_cov_1.215294_2_plen_91_part_01
MAISTFHRGGSDLCRVEIDPASVAQIYPEGMSGMSIYMPDKAGNAVYQDTKVGARSDPQTRSSLFPFCFAAALCEVLVSFDAVNTAAHNCR